MSSASGVFGPEEEFASVDLDWFKDVLEHQHAYVFKHGWDVCECGHRTPYFECGP